MLIHVEIKALNTSQMIALIYFQNNLGLFNFDQYFNNASGIKLMLGQYLVKFIFLKIVKILFL